VSSVLALLGAVIVVLVAAAETRLLRGRGLVALGLVGSVVAALAARSLTAEGFAVAAAAAIPFLLGLLLQEMSDALMLVTAPRRRRHNRRRRPRPRPAWWVPLDQPAEAEERRAA
jgi:hypothetical protein